jgi:hypothetical protein
MKPALKRDGQDSVVVVAVAAVGLVVVAAVVVDAGRATL